MTTRTKLMTSRSIVAICAILSWPLAAYGQDDAPDPADEVAPDQPLTPEELEQEEEESIPSPEPEQPAGELEDDSVSDDDDPLPGDYQPIGPQQGGDAEPAPLPASDEGSGIRMRSLVAEGKPSLFGSYRVRIALQKPKFDDGLEFYEELYGTPSWYPSIAVDWFAWDWYVTMGISLRAAYYSADGYTAKNVTKPTDEITADDIEKNKDSPTTLLILPAQLVATAEFTPFSGKWLVIDGWFGLERLYWQETRVESDSNEGALLLLQTSDESNEDTALVNRGFKSGVVFGASANILLNPLDERSVRSMAGTLGIGSVYLSPFIETVRDTSDDGVSFGRSSFGVGFTFESVR